MFYYVSVSRGVTRSAAVLGPFSTRDVAESWVDVVRVYVGRHYPGHAFDVYGVARSRTRVTGRLSATFGFTHH